MGSDFILTLYVLAIAIIVFGWILLICVNIWHRIKAPLSRLLRVKQRRVEITYVVSRKKFTFERKMDLVGVRFLDPVIRKKRKFWMQGGGLKEGDQGIISYQGVVGVNFEKIDSALKDEVDYHQKFNFAKKKKMDAEERQKVKKERRKRKYW